MPRCEAQRGVAKLFDGSFGKWHLGDEEAYQPQNRGVDEVLMFGGGGIGQNRWGDWWDSTEPYLINEDAPPLSLGEWPLQNMYEKQVVERGIPEWSPAEDPP